MSATTMLAAVLLPLAWASPAQDVVKETAEIAGQVAEQHAGIPLGYQVELADRAGEVLTSPVAPDGTFVLHASPGVYTVRLLLLGEEVHRQALVVGPQCAWLELPGRAVPRATAGLVASS